MVFNLTPILRRSSGGDFTDSVSFLQINNISRSDLDEILMLSAYKIWMLLADNT